jgi:hypothetical protein
MSGVLGSKQRSAEHSPIPAFARQMACMGSPPVVVVLGVAALEGWTAVDWPSTVVWGVLVTVMSRLFSMLGKAMGLTRMTCRISSAAR